MQYTLFFLLPLFLFCGAACQAPNQETAAENQAQTDSLDKKNLDQTPGQGYDFENNGKNRNAPLALHPFTDTILKNINLSSSPGLTLALAGSERYLRTKKRTHLLEGDFKITDAEIKSTIKAIKKWQTKGGELSDFVKMYQLDGEDGRSNVHFTGYYIPVLKVRKTKDAIYKYPLYRKPSKWSGEMPTRAAIQTDKALKGMGLELAYSASLLDNYTMQVQGSGLVEYPDGSRKLLSFGGKNGHPYKSLGKYLVAQGYVPADKISLTAIRAWTAANPDSLEAVLNYNPAYVFFNASNAKPSGAAGVPLIAKHSIAVDKNLIPLGSILLGEVPVLDAQGNLTHHEFRILTAHDVGGAIKKGHVDFFSGIGQEGENVANALHHYGRVWLLLKK